MDAHIVKAAITRDPYDEVLACYHKLTRKDGNPTSREVAAAMTLAAGIAARKKEQAAKDGNTTAWKQHSQVLTWLEEYRTIAVQKMKDDGLDW